MRDLAVASIIDASVAALFLRLLSRAWSVGPGRDRLRLRLLALSVPPLLPFAFLPLASLRDEERFRRLFTLFDSHRLGEWTFAGTSAAGLVFAAAAAAGAVLFLRDLLPLVGEGFGREPVETPPGERPPLLDDRVAALSGGRPIRVRYRRAPPGEHPSIFCRGIVSPTIWVDPSLVERLSPAELDAALAHEISHVVHQDGLTGWSIFAYRALFFWNPAVQLSGRSALAELESRADQEAVERLGATGPLAAALRTLGPTAESAAADGGGLRRNLRRSALYGSFLRRIEWLDGTTAPTGQAEIDRGFVLLAAVAVSFLLFFLT